MDGWRRKDSHPIHCVASTFPSWVTFVITAATAVTLVVCCSVARPRWIE